MKNVCVSSCYIWNTQGEKKNVRTCIWIYECEISSKCGKYCRLHFHRHTQAEYVKIMIQRGSGKINIRERMKSCFRRPRCIYISAGAIIILCASLWQCYIVTIFSFSGYNHLTLYNCPLSQRWSQRYHRRKWDQLSF